MNTGGITAPLDFSTKGEPSPKETRVVRLSKSTLDIDGLVTEKDAGQALLPRRCLVRSRSLPSPLGPLPCLLHAHSS